MKCGDSTFAHLYGMYSSPFPPTQGSCGAVRHDVRAPSGPESPRGGSLTIHGHVKQREPGCAILVYEVAE